MGAKQSKRSVDITSSPNKTGDSETINEGEGRVVKIGDVDVKAATNGTVPHTEKELVVGDKDKDENSKDLTVEKSVENKEKDVEEVKETKEEVKENGVSDSEELKTPDSDSTGDNLNESAAPEGKEGEATPETKKQKEKKKKKWSFRSISFSKKDKSKPSKEAEKNGEVKEVAEENAEDAKSPTSESPKTEKPETPAAEIVPVLNGDASKEEIVDTPKPEAAATEETKKEEPKVEETKPEEPKVEVKAEEPKVESKVEENHSELVESAPKGPIPVKTPVEETKEVRNEEVPPPLPSSNPPSSLTAFAESTKADILNTEAIDLLQVTSVVDPVLDREIGEPSLDKNIVEPKQELKATSPSESLPVSSSKCETEPHLKSPDLPKSEPLLETVDSEKSLGDLLVELPKSELTQNPQKSETLVELKSEDKPILTESATVVLQSQICEPSSESSLPETGKCEPKATEEPVVQEIISAVSSEASESSIPLNVDGPLPDPSKIELNLKPLPLVENEEKDLQSKTDLDVKQPPTETNVSEIPDPVDVKKSPENIALISQEDYIKPSSVVLPSQESFSSGFIQTEEDLKGPQLKPVELVIEDAKPKIEQLPSEHSLNYSEESESIDLPPPESDQLQAGIVEESGKSDLPSGPPAPITSEECPSPTDLPPPSAALVDPADSLQDISTESLPSLPEPLSENLAEPMSLPPVDSLPEPIATDCLPPESTNDTPLESNLAKTESEPFTGEPSSLVSEPLPLVAEPSSPSATESAALPTEAMLLATEIITIATDSIPSESDPLPPTECLPVLTNGSVNGLVAPGEASPTTNGGSILLGEAAPLKQVPQDVLCDVGKEEGDKAAPASTAEVPAVEE